ncbi:MAG TPA: tetratricopeptide repeat protein [Candidatus Angelobacter sp.]|nr:tetratricopeptide repeat protein [Candidatus Angelobacter sp.]
MSGSRSSRAATCSLLLVAWLLSFIRISAQTLSGPESLARQLFEQERWQQLADLPPEAAPHSAEFAYQRGIALAHLERWDEARASFLAGCRLAPRDKRFPLELAGVAFKQKHGSLSVAYLHRALRLDPGDAYAHEFLATIYYLRGNTEAAVQHWNRIQKPQVASLRSEPEPRVRPALLDHAFAFAPARILGLNELLASEARVQSLEIFPVYRFDLVARRDGTFDSVFRGQELNGWGSTWFEGLLRTFRGLPLQEVTPEYYNLNRSAINLASLVRWDPDKRRLVASLSSPLWRDPRWHFALAADLRNENWDVLGPRGQPPLLAVNMRRDVFKAEIARLVGARWKWSTETELSHRDYRNAIPQFALPPEMLAQGFQIKQTLRASYELWRSAAHRFSMSSSGAAEAARLWSTSPQSFERLQGALDARWFPRARGDDFETHGQLRAARTFGQLSFDELFMLGLERDNDLWMHGHVGTRDGRKGSAPLGRNFILANWETDKNIYSNGFLTLKLGPLLDTGKITNASLPAFGSQKWLWDTGVQLKVRALGVQAGFSYGKDLRTGNNAFYATVGR